ncbi:Crp/Fnr family transcriptional regulator [Mesobacillus harenae]|uniref:Crp/Fnr family transcriptional regulator n=1 Tax=Mesobacillus harenae TaxID=2213203 RepID=UPI0015802B27|nr:Crp/Fnr family transcriptional regulator [Mesobacillus harenae]
MQASLAFSSALKELLQSVHHIRQVQKGTYLFDEGSIADELYVVQSGKIQISKVIPDGRELTMRMCSQGELIGEINLFSPVFTHFLNARVVEAGSVAVIKKDKLEEMLAINNVLALEMIKWLSNQYRRTQTKFRDLVLHGKKGALISTLIRLSNSYGVQSPSGIQIGIALTNQELANFCGTSREVVNRLLSDLRRNKILQIDKGIITILDLQYLKDEIECENCPVSICNIE